MLRGVLTTTVRVSEEGFGLRSEARASHEPDTTRHDKRRPRYAHDMTKIHDQDM